MSFSTPTTAVAHLGPDPLIAVAGQNVAGSIAIIACPPRIALMVGVALGAGEQLPGLAVRTLLAAVATAAVLLGVWSWCWHDRCGRCSARVLVRAAATAGPLR